MLVLLQSYRFKLQFYEEGDYITASWNPQHNYEVTGNFTWRRRLLLDETQPGQFILKPKHQELRKNEYQIQKR